MKPNEIGVVLPVAMVDALNVAIDLTEAGMTFVWHVTDPYGVTLTYPGTRDLGFINVINLTTVFGMFSRPGSYAYECWVSHTDGRLFKSTTLAITVQPSVG